jgi:hypothetical protein
VVEMVIDEIDTELDDDEVVDELDEIDEVELHELFT